MAPLVAALAQLVEHIIRNDGVRCSSHLSGTITSSREIQQIWREGLSEGSSFGFYVGALAVKRIQSQGSLAALLAVLIVDPTDDCIHPNADSTR